MLARILATVTERLTGGYYADGAIGVASSARGRVALWHAQRPPLRRFQAVILPGSIGYALYPSAQVAHLTVSLRIAWLQAHAQCFSCIVRVLGAPSRAGTAYRNAHAHAHLVCLATGRTPHRSALLAARRTYEACASRSVRTLSASACAPSTRPGVPLRLIIHSLWLPDAPARF